MLGPKLCGKYIVSMQCEVQNQYTLSSTYNEKKYVEILLHYRWLFIKGDIIIGEWGIFGAEIFLRYSRFFVKGDFIIGRVECIYAS